MILKVDWCTCAAAVGSLRPSEACVGEDCGPGAIFPGARRVWGRKVEKKFLDGMVMLTFLWLETRSLRKQTKHRSRFWKHTHSTHTLPDLPLTSLPLFILFLVSSPWFSSKSHKEAFCQERLQFDCIKWDLIFIKSSKCLQKWPLHLI